jgi:hypothetical protein
MGLLLTDGISVTLGHRDTLVLMYNSISKSWVEISRSNAVNDDKTFADNILSKKYPIGSRAGSLKS